MDKKVHRKQKVKNILTVCLITLAVFVVTAGSTLVFAYVINGGLENDFDRTYVTCQVNSTEDVTNVTNTSDVDAYIRTAILVTWKDSNGKSRWTLPKEGIEYKLTVDANPAWGSEHAWYLDESTNFYYHKASVAPQQITKDLISAIELLVTPPEGCELSVEVVAEAIQTPGVIPEDGDAKQALADAWSITVLG